MMSLLRHRLRSARWKVSVAVGIAAASVAGVGLTAVSGAHAAAGCRVDYAVPSQWPGGFTANVKVTNLGEAFNGWSLVWTFPSGQRVTQIWNATHIQPAATVTATNVGYNAAIPTNGSVSFGFNGSWSGANVAPDSFALNGVTCTGDAGSPSPSISPSVSPSRLVAVDQHLSDRPHERAQPVQRAVDPDRDRVPQSLAKAGAGEHQRTAVRRHVRR